MGKKKWHRAKLGPSEKQIKTEEEWDKLMHQVDNKSSEVVIFGNIKIAEDGGFSEVPELWYPLRWLTAFLTLSFLVSNVYYIIDVDWNILSGNKRFQRCTVVPDHDPSTAPDCQEGFLLTATVSSTVMGSKKHGDDLIALIELVGLTLWLSYMTHEAARALGTRVERVRWISLERIFWSILPQLTAYSAMRMLHYITPTVLTAELGKALADTKMEKHPLRVVLRWVRFVGFSFIALVIGFDSFLVKVRAVHNTISSPTVTFNVLMATLVFIVQVLGIVQLSMFVKERLFVFIFAGEDAVMAPEEKAKKRVWNAMLAREIWKTSDSFIHFLVIMLSFDDADFQKLVLNERKDPGGEDSDSDDEMIRQAMMLESAGEDYDYEDEDEDDVINCCGRGARL